MSIAATEKQRVIKVYRELKIELAHYELQYGMSSRDFYVKFNRGDLPEREEYFRWQVAYVGLMYIEKRNPWLIEDE